MFVDNNYDAVVRRLRNELLHEEFRRERIEKSLYQIYCCSRYEDLDVCSYLQPFIYEKKRRLLPGVEVKKIAVNVLKKYYRLEDNEE